MVAAEYWSSLTNDSRTPLPLFTSAAGTPLHYDLQGEGPLLVCHPGGPARPASYLETLGGLDRHRTLLLLEPRGVGRSGAADAYRFTDLADDLEALRLHLGVDDLDLLGHSAGALPVSVYAARHPSRVRSLVLLTPTRRLVPMRDGETDRDTYARQLFRQEPWLGDALAAFEAMPLASTDEERDALSARLMPLFYGRWDSAARAHAFDEHGSTPDPVAGAGFADPGFESAAFAAATAPVSILAGDRDWNVGTRAPEVMAGWFPKAEIAWLRGCGHFPWIDDPRQTSSAILDALSTWSDQREAGLA
jgi:proline iminopeptidase